MEVKIIAFGKIADILTKKEWKMEDVKTTAEIREKLASQFPQLQQLNYMISVNKKIVNTNTQLSADAEIALLPPFSGG